ncbi:MAG: phosphoenolpyruvate--protein phosphotransferase [Candidatus Omnitrophica bacterium]|nr:phosphoenolpyruvate--protein phosphotransferase [Candidatus Omnitrophota bacterium]
MNRQSLELKGIPAAEGIAIGPAYKLGKEIFDIPKKSISEEEIPLQIQIFEEALTQTRKEILGLQQIISREMGKETADIFNAHLLVLEDRMFIEEVIQRLKEEKLNVAYICSEVLKKYISIFSKIEDDYLKERIVDINDVGKRILRHLTGRRHPNWDDLKEKVIVVAHDLSPSDTATMHKKKVIGFVTDVGGKTSHTAIMAKSLEIPAVVGLEDATAKISDGDILIVDGKNGLVIVNPDEDTLRRYREEEKNILYFTSRFLATKDLPAQTLDGKMVKVSANIELPDEIDSAKEHGAEGIGLYRTEFFYMNRDDLPSEEEHYQAYRSVVEKMYPYEVIIRTLDLGGDKFVSQFKVPKDMVPFLGWRAIRFCLTRPDIFKIQLRAILKASIHGKIKLMYPMISGIDELRRANYILEECKEELKKEGIPFDENIEIGAMIELPSAALTSDLLAEEADFFSIGTNDLIQYSLAVDRTNEKVAYLYEPAHPAVLRMIKNIIETAHSKGIWVGMCGEMAGELKFVPLLLGLGLDEFSAPPMVIPQIKYAIRCLNLEEAKAFAKEALRFSSGKEVEDFCEDKIKQIMR